MFIVAIVFLVVAVGMLLAAKALPDGSKYDDFNLRRAVRLGALIPLLLALVIAGTTMVYSQDPGEAKVQKSITGEVVGVSVDDGFHFKAPWVSIVTYDVRNLVVEYVGDGQEGNYASGSATGSQITVQVANGASADIDISVRYSINPDAALDIYKRFGSQEAFTTSVIENDIRSIVRNAPARYSAIDFVQKREEVVAEISEALSLEWEDRGIFVEEVNLQEIRFSETVKQTFEDAQSATNLQEAARAQQQTATITAETKRIEAQGVADSNAILTQSLTPEVLTQRYLDALKAGTVFVVPEGSTPMIQTQQAPSATP